MSASRVFFIEVLPFKFAVSFQGCGVGVLLPLIVFQYLEVKVRRGDTSKRLVSKSVGWLFRHFLRNTGNAKKGLT